MIQFLKGCSPKDEQEILERLEPEKLPEVKEKAEEDFKKSSSNRECGLIWRARPGPW
ncbi:MAG: hypothetical protein V8S98_11935 [Lachnospiraceae bacterium]